MSEKEKLILFVAVGVFILAVFHARSQQRTRAVSRARRITQRTGGQGTNPFDDTAYNVATLATVGGLIL